MKVYYNDNDPKCCAWLRELIVDGLIFAGVVDCRSITDIDPASLADYDQCHFFAGIGGWPLALLWADWPADRQVWTGSCPCQPFSCAGKGRGTDDERHLWPAFRRLIAECRPATVFGEQVASKAGREWLAGVRSDLETLAYAVGAADLCAASVGAPHIRQRLWWVANSQNMHGIGSDDNRRSNSEMSRSVPESGDGSDTGVSGGLADPEAAERGGVREKHTGRGDAEVGRSSGVVGGLGNGIIQGLEGHGRLGEEPVPEGRSCWNGPTIWHPCRDGKQRRIPGRMVYATGIGQRGGSKNCTGEQSEVLGQGLEHCTESERIEIEPALFPLAHGIPGRVGLLRGAGNTIVPEVAAEFIRAYLETDR